MTKMSAAIAAALRLACAIATGAVALTATTASADWKSPWKTEDKALVVDAYEFNPIDWKELTSDKRIAGFINKASDGLAPDWNCAGKSGDDEKLCKNRWWKYSVTKELYMTRREMAKTLGLKWGAYHLGRPGNPREQADHFVDFAEPGPDDLIALDIEDNTSEWMSLADAEIFANQIFIRLGRYPVLYTNGSTAKWVSDYKDKYPLLARLPLWYARYRDDITGMFPEETWPTYALWQFSSMHNCGDTACPYRVKGARSDIDVNVSPLGVAELQKAWPFDNMLQPEKPAATTLIAKVSDTAKAEVAKVVASIAGKREDGGNATKVAEVGGSAIASSMVAAYGPSGRPKIDPLKLLTQAAYEERHPGEREAVARPVDDNAPTPLAAAAASAVAQVPAKDPIAAVQAIVETKAAKGAKELAALALSLPAPDAAVKARRAAEMTGEQKSRFASMMKAAEIQKAAGTLGMPAYVLSQAPVGSSSRGPRLSTAAKKEPTHLAGLTVLDQRIAGAFAATR
ncbi:glycoside hydrolase family 25 protein [Mangrovicella endophytica]|uniref:glycoside hydrolase family 25 protein n=1 Tax=Mangrovicella endophytica TaxID=2066697 RepID=UPI000C9E11BB|nr:glycoside hydrolase family 25 protein [Mangrovicella endophytica]